MTRSLLALFALSTVALPAAGQVSLRDLAPIRFLADADAATGHEAFSFSVGMDGETPLEYFLPNVSPGSRLLVMGLGLGARIVDGDASFRWRVVPLVIDMAKPPWNGGVTVLRYDRTGLRTVEADWIATHGGPAGRFSLGRLEVNPSLALRAALATRKTGRGFFPGLSGTAEDGATGAATAAVARIQVASAGGFRLSAQASVERLWAGPDPELRSLEATIRLPVGDEWALVGRGALVEARVGSARDRATVVGFGLRFSPRPGRTV